MAENEKLRLEMEDYIKKHDITRLFERLTASIMYDRPDDLNRYIGEWLLRLDPTKVTPKQPIIDTKSTTSSILPAVSVLPVLPATSETSVASFTSSFIDSTQPSNRLSVPRNEASGSDLFSTVTVLPDFKQHISENVNTDRKNEFAPYVFTPENIAIFYGMLDPLNEGFVAVDHFREVAALMDVHRHIPWEEIRGQNIQRVDFCEFLITALKLDLDTLRTSCQGEI